MGEKNRRKRGFKAPGEGDWSRAFATTAVAAGDIVRVVSTTDGGAYYNVVPAIADGSQSGTLMFAAAAAGAGDPTWVKEVALLDMDTSAGALGDFVYLSSTVAGAPTLTTSSSQVGRVSRVATAGQALVGLGSGASGGPGTIKVLKHRVQVADLTTAGTSQSFLWSDSVPAFNAIMGGAVYVTDTPAGGGATNVTVTVTESIDGRTYIELEDLIASTAGAFVGTLNASPDGIDGTTNFSLNRSARQLVVNVGSNVNVDTLTACDITVFVFYVDAGVIVP